MLEQDPDAKWPDDQPIPEIPEELADVWAWYWEIREGVPSGLNGVEPLPCMEIKAWSELTGTPIRPRDLRFLRIMDRVFLEDRAQQIQLANKAQMKPVINRHGRR